MSQWQLHHWNGKPWNFILCILCTLRPFSLPKTSCSGNDKNKFTLLFLSIICNLNINLSSLLEQRHASRTQVSVELHARGYESHFRGLIFRGSHSTVKNTKITSQWKIPTIWLWTLVNSDSLTRRQVLLLVNFHGLVFHEYRIVQEQVVS